MGKASGGDRQNFGDVVNGHVHIAKPSERTPMAVPKGTGRSRAGRGTKRLLGDGSRGKDEGGDEAPGCASRRPSGAGESRSYEGSGPLSPPGIVCVDILACSQRL